MHKQETHDIDNIYGPICKASCHYVTTFNEQLSNLTTCVIKRLYADKHHMHQIAHDMKLTCQVTFNVFLCQIYRGIYVIFYQYKQVC